MVLRLDTRRRAWQLTFRSQEAWISNLQTQDEGGLVAWDIGILACYLSICDYSAIWVMVHTAQLWCRKELGKHPAIWEDSTVRQGVKNVELGLRPHWDGAG